MYLHFKGKQWDFIKKPQFHGEINTGHNVSELAHYGDRTWERLMAFLNQGGQNPLAAAGQNPGPLPCTYINTRWKSFLNNRFNGTMFASVQNPQSSGHCF